MRNCVFVLFFVFLFVCIFPVSVFADVLTIEDFESLPYGTCQVDDDTATDNNDFYMEINDIEFYPSNIGSGEMLKICFANGIDEEDYDEVCYFWIYNNDGMEYSFNGTLGALPSGSIKVFREDGIIHFLVDGVEQNSIFDTTRISRIVFASQNFPSDGANFPITVNYGFDTSSSVSPDVFTWKDSNGYQLLGPVSCDDGSAEYTIEFDVNATSPFLSDYSFRVNGGNRTNELARDVDIVGGRLCGNIDFSSILNAGTNTLTFEILDGFEVIASTSWDFEFPINEDRYINLPINFDVIQVNNFGMTSADIGLIGIGDGITVQIIEKTSPFGLPNEPYNYVLAGEEVKYFRINSDCYIKFSYVGGTGSASVFLPGVYGQDLVYTGYNYTTPPDGSSTTPPPTGDIPSGTPGDDWDWETPPTVDTEASFWAKMVQYTQLLIYWVSTPFRWVSSTISSIASEIINSLGTIKQSISGITGAISSFFDFLPANITSLIVFAFSLGFLLKLAGRG